MNYQSKFFSWDLAYNHTKGKDNASNASITSIEPDTLTSRLDIPTPNSCSWNIRRLCISLKNSDIC
ncbi:hypothetical protein LOS07_15995, partial [Proteus mirabilis]|uniref:hypothetical protein n=1 Tax=Proteus mirabilis TaxID=584 RepID=UPI001E48FDB8